jgi:hypothetical protein
VSIDECIIQSVAAAACRRPMIAQYSANWCILLDNTHSKVVSYRRKKEIGAIRNFESI